MVYDKVTNASRYFGLHPNFEKAMRFLATQDYGNMATGRHETNDEDLAFEILEYRGTCESANKLVAHRRRGEIWVMLTANEKIRLAPLQECVETAGYVPETDRVDLLASAHTMFPMAKGFFVVLLPTDAHSHEPVGADEVVRKVILWFRL